ncbi:MAG TPA: murein transglycosylase [Gammaproteobacteria bacterium]|nr:murein transglycosylase [Gammaproteobacteria bacterium]
MMMIIRRCLFSIQICLAFSRNQQHISSRLSVLTRRIAMPLMMALSVTSPAEAKSDFELQRKAYLQAERALKSGNLKSYQSKLQELNDYPLLPYLKYEELKRDLDLSNSEKINSFVQIYADAPPSGWMQRRWLNYLAQNQQWDAFLRAYEGTEEHALECHHRTALLELGYPNAAFQGIEQLWVVGHSQPDECDKVFAAWIKSTKFEHALVWDRLFLVVSNGRTSLADYLTRFLPVAEQPRVTTLIEAHRHPQRLLKNPDQLTLTDTIDARIYAYAVTRLAKRSPELAAYYWQHNQQALTLKASDRYQVMRYLALKYASRNLDGASERLSSIPERFANEKVRTQRIRTALSNQDWQSVLTWIQALPKEEQQEPRWRYWRARSLLERGHQQAANTLFEQLVAERDYHAFLAADRLEVNYQLGHAPVAVTSAELQALSRIPGLVRANELYSLRRYTSAYREWNQVISKLSGRQLIVAAKLAKQWGWHYNAIATAAKAEYWDDVELRFPLEFQPQVTLAATQASISPAWAFGVLRQESAFNQHALSSAGAVGLMQLMPYTGKSVASELGERITRNHQLLDIQRNIRYGTRYLSKLLKRYDGQTALATAAYNAGPTRVDRWKTKLEELPADVWIETQPFSETRKYVNNVLAYTIIYENRLGQKDNSLISDFLPRQPMTLEAQTESQTIDLSYRQNTTHPKLKLADNKEQQP